MADPSESITTPSLSDLSGKVQLGDSETKTCFQGSSSGSEVPEIPILDWLQGSESSDTDSLNYFLINRHSPKHF